MSTNDQRSTSDDDGSFLASAKERASRMVTPRGVLDLRVAELNLRIDDEIQGVEGRLARSIRDEVARLEDLIRELYLRIDTFIAEVGRAEDLAAALEVRLAEVVELRSQTRSAERAEARRLDALEERVAELEERSSPGA